MARTAASSRPRARSTRSSSLSASAAAFWAWVIGICGFQASRPLDAPWAERFPWSASEKNTLPVVFSRPFGGPARRRRFRRLLGRRREGLDQFRIIVSGAVDRGRNLVSFEQVLRRGRDQGG